MPLWAPEVGGAIDPANDAHGVIISTFGYTKLGLHLTYHPTQQTMRAEARLRPRTAWANGSCPRAGVEPNARTFIVTRSFLLGGR